MSQLKVRADFRFDGYGRLPVDRQAANAPCPVAISSGVYLTIVKRRVWLRERPPLVLVAVSWSV
jgi:hypothetical protein